MIRGLDGGRETIASSSSRGSVMSEHEVMTTLEYLNTAEYNQHRELAYGVLREPPAPFFTHQNVVLKIGRILCDHVEPQNLGKVAIAPLDVVLDRERALVVQPDVLFVATERLGIIRDQVWGAPDLVVEVLSPGTESHDRGEKLGWYRQYGVRECWLVDPYAERAIVFDFMGATPAVRSIDANEHIQSAVFPSLRTAPGVFFAV
jgi:Uma2 family endonuclease